MATAYGKVSKGTGFEAPNIEDDYYLARVKKVEDGTSTWDGIESPQYRVEFELLEVQSETGANISLLGFIRIPEGVVNDGVLNENSKLYEFLVALGYDDDDMDIDPEAWLGKKVRVNVQNKEIKTGQNAGQVRPRITGYKPPKGSGPAIAAAKRTGRGGSKEEDEDF